MAKIKIGIKSEVAGSTILEVVISMVLIIFVIGIALMILANVTRLSLSTQKLRAAALLQQELNHDSTKLIDSIETLKHDGIRIEKTVSPSRFGGSLYNLQLSAYDENNLKLANLKSIVVYDK